MAEIWRDVLKDTERNEAQRKSFRLPVIVPIVLYNGRNAWTAPTSYKEILNGFDLFGKYVLDFEYVLIDINRFSDQELVKLSNLPGAVLLLDKKADNMAVLLDRLRQLAQTIGRLSPEEFGLFRSWIEHILVKNIPVADKSKIIEIIEKSSKTEVNTMVTNIERLLQEEFEKVKQKGIEKGIEQGIEKGRQTLIKSMLARGLTIEAISDYTGLPVDEVKRITELPE
ncbi:MAG: hypothetical protein PWQ93_1391 [Clostridiales bacterium]|nr:hypothetical protein [Clostridiales bacterium]